jgi:glucosamine--fructose-6-phosphate aminotransferase (isomerizing)
MLEKLHANMEEVKARGGQLYVFAHDGVEIAESFGDKVVAMPCSADKTTAILSTIPLQLLSYHVAVLRGTDVDQPRNLAKSVTVE